MKKIFFFNILILYATISFAQDAVNWNTKRDKIKIPFELSHNLIIVDVVFNGVKLKMIADTGASKSIVFSLPENDSMVLNEADLITISGVGISEKVEGYLSKKNRIQIKNYLDDDFEAIFVFDRNISLVNNLGIPINGILGSSFFKTHLIEIDYQRKIITLHKNKQKKINKIRNSYEVSKIEIYKDRPYVFMKTKLEDNEFNLKLLFDSGLGDGLWLFENDSISCNSNYFIDFLGKGISGDVYGKKSRVKEVSIESNVLKNALVSYPDVSFFDKNMIVKNRNGSLGGEILKRFNWFLDYENNKVYSKKNLLFYKPFNYNMSGIEVKHSGFQYVKEKEEFAFASHVIKFDENSDINNSNNFRYELKPNFEIHSIRKNSPAEKVGLIVGDKILKINNNSSYNLSIQNILDLFQSKDGKQITIIVDRNGEILTFKFNLESVL
ncbi:PDZ domain-containing protein [Flavobacterium sp.]|uniref:PDZ domain-containing protein n=1 Tax=Flavobacterium sp. TaxID=239 RepID=UPI004047582C